MYLGSEMQLSEVTGGMHYPSLSAKRPQLPGWRFHSPC